jgi:hypothetical protein
MLNFMLLKEMSSFISILETLVHSTIFLHFIPNLLQVNKCSKHDESMYYIHAYNMWFVLNIKLVLAHTSGSCNSHNIMSMQLETIICDLKFTIKLKIIGIITKPLNLCRNKLNAKVLLYS